MNEIGKRYGHLVVIKNTGKRVHETTVFLCKCDCGNLTEVDVNKLHSGHTKSCGCLKHEIKDLTGKRFGRLLVIAFDGRKKNKTWWRCKCDCGNECIVSSTCLTHGQTKSCGCKNKENQSIVSSLKKDFVDGTCLSSIKEGRKINKNNNSGYTGVHYDKDRKQWIAQIMFARKNHLIGRFKNKSMAITARKTAEGKYYGKYRKNKI